MIKIDFRKVSVQTSFDGTRREFDVAQALGNAMMYNGSVLLDIGFEELAKAIYYSEGGTEVPERYASAMKQVIRESQFIAGVKRELIEKLTINN